MALQPRGTQQKLQDHCRYCGRRLDSLGYHWACHTCGASYCYIHMAKHATAHAEARATNQW